jgi:hypothetical protein
LLCALRAMLNLDGADAPSAQRDAEL